MLPSKRDCLNKCAATNKETTRWKRKSMERKSGEREELIGPRVSEGEKSERKRRRLMCNHSTLCCSLITKSIPCCSSPAPLRERYLWKHRACMCVHAQGLYDQMLWSFSLFSPPLRYFFARWHHIHSTILILQQVKQGRPDLPSYRRSFWSCLMQV